MFLIILKLSNVQVAIFIYLYPSSMPFILFKLSFIEFSFSRNIYSNSCSFLFVNLPKIYFVFTFNKLEGWRVKKFLQFKDIMWEQFIGCKKFAQFLLPHFPYIFDNSLLLCCMHSQHFHIQFTLIDQSLMILLLEGYLYFWIMALSIFILLIPHNKIIQSIV